MQTALSAAVPAVFKLLAHDVRWRIVVHLAQSDYRVGDLVDLVGERQNLVSYHLRLLRDADLVGERRSSRDGRDIYYSLDLAHLGSGLDQSGSQLHPAFARSQPSLEPPSRRSVLFLCTGNSARSQMAEALVRKKARGRISASSAGTRPQGVHPVALEVLHDRGVRTAGLRSKRLDELEGGSYDLVVTLCDIAREECPSLPNHNELTHWSLADPAAVNGSHEAVRRAFEQTADELSERIDFLIRRQ